MNGIIFPLLYMPTLDKGKIIAVGMVICVCFWFANITRRYTRETTHSTHARTTPRRLSAFRHWSWAGPLSLLLHLNRSLSSVLKSQLSLLGSRSCRTAMRPSGAAASKQQDGRWSVPTETAAVSRADRLHVEGRLRSAACRSVPYRARLNIGGVHGLRELRIYCVCFAQPWPRRASCSPTVIKGNHLGLYGLFGSSNYNSHPVGENLEG